MIPMFLKHTKLILKAPTFEAQFKIFDFMSLWWEQKNEYNFYHFITYGNQTELDWEFDSS